MAPVLAEQLGGGVPHCADLLQQMRLAELLQEREELRGQIDRHRRIARRGHLIQQYHQIGQLKQRQRRRQSGVLGTLFSQKPSEGPHGLHLAGFQLLPLVRRKPRSEIRA